MKTNDAEDQDQRTSTDLAMADPDVTSKTLDSNQQLPSRRSPQ
jgi:hypothetical protein